jgi:hypothetical protein
VPPAPIAEPASPAGRAILAVAEQAAAQISIKSFGQKRTIPLVPVQ